MWGGGGGGINGGFHYSCRSCVIFNYYTIGQELLPSGYELTPSCLKFLLDVCMLGNFYQGMKLDFANNAESHWMASNLYFFSLTLRIFQGPVQVDFWSYRFFCGKKV